MVSGYFRSATFAVPVADQLAPAETADGQPARSLGTGDLLRPRVRSGGMSPASLRAAMRRLLATLLAASALLAAGCGGEDGGSPLDTALSYLPDDVLFAVALETDLDGDQVRAVDDLLDEFVFADQARDFLREQVEQAAGGSFEEDIRPLTGNPVVIGGIRGEGGTMAGVGAIQVEDEDRLNDVLDRRGGRKIGESDGNALYQEGETVYAVDGDVFVFADGRRAITAALERAGGDDHMDEESFDAALEGLPDGPLARLYVDMEAALRSDPGSADARKVKWIDALRKMGLTVRARDGALDVDFRVATEGDLSEEDLPIASGDESPGVIEREGEIGLGIRDLAHIVRFAENAGQAIDPAGFGDYQRAKKTIDAQLGVDLDEDLIGQLTGDVSASVALDGGFGVRAELKDPAAFNRTLSRVVDVLPDFARGAGFGEVELGHVDGPDTIYMLTSRETGGTVAFAVIGDVLVVAERPPQVLELADREPGAVEDARGSAVLGADAEQVANAFIDQFGDAFGIPDVGGLGRAFITGPLGDLRGSLVAEPDALRGKLTLTLD